MSDGKKKPILSSLRGMLSKKPAAPAAPVVPATPAAVLRSAPLPRRMADGLEHRVTCGCHPGWATSVFVMDEEARLHSAGALVEKYGRRLHDEATK